MQNDENSDAIGRQMRRMETARDWFGRVRDYLQDLEDEQDRIDDMRLQTGPRGQSLDKCGHGSRGDSDAALLAVMQAEEDLGRMRRRVNAEVAKALQVLYGKSGRGGLAKAKTSADADCICGHYLQLMTWPEVSDELVKPDSKDGPQWCKRRAHRALEFIDRYGFERLANS